MSNDVQFEDYSIHVKGAINDAVIAFLEEAGGELEARTKRNCAVQTGQTAGSFQYVVDEDELACHVGSDYENAIWEEFGTGIYAFNGDGRTDVPWRYKDSKGQWHTTSGKPPKRMLWNAFEALRSKIIQEAERRFGELG